MSVFRPLAALLAVALVTSACSGEIMTSELFRSNSGHFFRYGASAGEMKAVVVGNPFPVSQAVLDKAVTAAMQHNYNGPTTRFTTTPGPKAHANFRVVVAFNTPTIMNDDLLCGAPDAIPTGKSDSRLHASVAFCVDSDLYSSVHISIPTVQSPADPAFRHMIASAMWQLIPAYDPTDHHNNMCVGSGC